MKAYLVVIVYKDGSVLVDSVFNDFDAAETHVEQMRNEIRLVPNSRIDFIYTTHGYDIR